MVNKRHPDMPVSLDSSVTEDAKLSQLPSQLSSLWNTPKLKAPLSMRCHARYWQIEHADGPFCRG